MRLGITNDDFIRTTEPRHARIVQQILQKLWEAGEIYFGKYGGHYCYGCERFYTDKEIVDGKCPDHETPLAWIEEENYFFRMSAYQGWLIEYITAHPDFIRPERYRNEILGFLREPLQDLSISRPRTRLEWGIPLPFDDRFVTYVWFDALINYVSALGEIGGERYATFWPHVQHLIGKDILKPHGVYWPCMLKAAGLPTYTRLNVHGFWRLGGGKMSKSIGNVVEALALTDTYGHDAFRYFVMREAVFGLDADFSEEALVGRLNADLANDLGNLVARATTLLAAARRRARPGEATPGRDWKWRPCIARCGPTSTPAMGEFAFSRALSAIWGWLGVLNRYVDAEQPWTLAKDPARPPAPRHRALHARRVAALPRHRPRSVLAPRRREDPRGPRPPRRTDPGRRRVGRPPTGHAGAQALGPLPARGQGHERAASWEPGAGVRRGREPASGGAAADRRAPRRRMPTPARSALPSMTSRGSICAWRKSSQRRRCPSRRSF